MATVALNLVVPVSNQNMYLCVYQYVWYVVHTNSMPTSDQRNLRVESCYTPVCTNKHCKCCVPVYSTHTRSLHAALVNHTCMWSPSFYVCTPDRYMWIGTFYHCTKRPSSFIDKSVACYKNSTFFSLVRGQRKIPSRTNNQDGSSASISFCFSCFSSFCFSFTMATSRRLSWLSKVGNLCISSF